MIPGLVGYSTVEFVVVFNPETPDRTVAITGGGESPVPHLRDSALLLQAMGASHIVYACNTAHYFVPQLLGSGAPPTPLRVPVVDMIHATVELAADAGIRRVGLLATTGTIEVALYQEALRRKQIEVLLPSTDRRSGEGLVDGNGRVLRDVYSRMAVVVGEPLAGPVFQSLAQTLVGSLGEQEGLVMEAVYGAHGVKAGLTTGIVGQLAHEAARQLVDRGAEGIILGCTELPLVMKGVHLRRGRRAIMLIDPAEAVAARLKRIGGSHGIAGGLGPDATVAFLEAMDAPGDFIELQRDIVRATREELGAARDQEHLKMFGIASRDPVSAARRVARAGAGFLVMARSAAWATEEAAAAAHLPALVHAGRQLGRDVVLRARRPWMIDAGLISSHV
jgi:aspartate/glutamate racemase